MICCCCSMAGAQACQHCVNNFHIYYDPYSVPEKTLMDAKQLEELKQLIKKLKEKIEK